MLEERLVWFSKKDFVRDLSPFVPRDERENLSSFYNYIIQYLRESFEGV